jgi:hypothetical protein
MDPAYLDYLLIAAGTFALTSLGFAIAWLRARERAIRAEEQPAEPTVTDIAARFDRLEQLAEDTARELERLAEAQRFQSRLLAERSVAALPRTAESADGFSTPH